MRVAPVNDAPSLSFPHRQAVDEDAELVIYGLNLHDVDEAAQGGARGLFEVSLAVAHGALWLGSDGRGLVFHEEIIDGAAHGFLLFGIEKRSSVAAMAAAYFSPGPSASVEI